MNSRYFIRGEILNRGGTAGTPSKLIITYRKGLEVIGWHTYPLTVPAVAPGQRQSFRQQLDNPPAGATDIVPSVE